MSSSSLSSAMICSRPTLTSVFVRPAEPFPLRMGSIDPLGLGGRASQLEFWVLVPGMLMLPWCACWYVSIICPFSTVTVLVCVMPLLPSSVASQLSLPLGPFLPRFEDDEWPGIVSCSSRFLVKVYSKLSTQPQLVMREPAKHPYTLLYA